MEFLNALGFDFKMVFMQAVGFLILLFLLKKFLFGKIKDMIKARADDIKETYRKSEEDKTAAEKLKEEYQQKVSKADEEAEKKIHIAVESAKEYSNEIIKKGQQKVAEDRASAQQGIEVEKKRALAEVRNQVVDLTVLTSSKLIKKSIDKGTAEALVDEVISGVGKLS